MAIQFGLPATYAGVGVSADLNQTSLRQFGAPAVGDVNDTTVAAGSYTPSFLPPIRARLRWGVGPNEPKHFRAKVGPVIAPIIKALLDSITSADSFSGALGPTAKVLADTVNSGDYYSIPGSSSTSLGDTVGSADIFAASGPATPTLLFDGLVRKVLALYAPGVSTTYGPIPVFPALPGGFPVKVVPVLDTIIGTTKSLREVRVAQQTYPIWDIEILFEELLDETQNQTLYGPLVGYQQYTQIVQTWLSMYGQTGVFAFACPWDYSRANQYIGTGDGSSYSFLIYATWGLGAQAQLLPVGMVNAVQAVYVNGVGVATSNYVVVRNRLYFINSLGLTFPPAAGAEITMTFTYYYLCRFTEDEQDYEEFAKNRWAVPSLKFRASPWV